MFVKIQKRHYATGLMLALLLGLYANDQAITAVNIDPQIKVILYDTGFRGTGWTPNGEVEFAIYDFPGGELIIGPQTFPVDGEGSFLSPPITYFIPDMFLRVKDVSTSTIKELTIPILEVTSIDHETNIINGLAPPSTDVWIEIDGTDIGKNILSDSNGNWDVNFTGSFDIGPEDTATILYWDEDGDQASGRDGAPLYLQGGYDDDWMEFYYYSPANTITYQVLDNLGSLLSSGEIQTNVKGWAHISISIHEIEFQPGYQIIGIDHRRNISDTITMQAITTDLVNYDTDELSGTAPANADMRINIGRPGEQYSFPDQADGNGDWSIGLMVEHGFDLTVDYWVYATTFDENKNSTFAALDEDFDQTGNGKDNAMLIYNPDQSDLDEDAIGDVVDPCPSILDNTCNPDRSGAVSINQDGGTLTTPEGDTSVMVPAGSLSTDRSISITDTGEDYLWSFLRPVAYKDSPETWVVFSNFIGPPSITVAAPISITFSWDDINNDGIVDDMQFDEKDLLIYHDGIPLTNHCEFDSGCDREANNFVITTMELRNFALVGEKSNFLVYLPLAIR